MVWLHPSRGDSGSSSAAFLLPRGSINVIFVLFWSTVSHSRSYGRQLHETWNLLDSCVFKKKKQVQTPVENIWNSWPFFYCQLGKRYESELEFQNCITWLPVNSPRFHKPITGRKLWNSKPKYASCSVLNTAIRGVYRHSTVLKSWSGHRIVWLVESIHVETLTHTLKNSSAVVDSWYVCVHHMVVRALHLFALLRLKTT